MILAGGMRGLLAYDGATPVGWCHYDLLANLPGTRAFTEGLASDDPQSAAVVCFTVAQGWRSRGVATGLLSAALADLKDRGVTRVEAYPVLASESPEHNYPGPPALYAQFGFTQIRQAKKRALVEKRL
jgi:GNAT superfamily N-acetyltransferase